MPVVHRASHLQKTTRLLLAFLVFLGASAQCLSSFQCPAGERPDDAVRAVGGLTNVADTHVDHHGSPHAARHHEGQKSCCCSITDPGTATLPPGTVAFAPILTFDALAPTRGVAVCPTAVTIEVERIPFHADNSPPSLSLAPHFGRAPPVA